MPTRAAEADIVVAPDDPDQPEILALLAESDAWYAAMYPAESNHLIDVAVLKQPNVAFFTARKSGRVIGYGSIVRQVDRNGAAYGEVKRMYVAPAVRGLGLGRLLMETLLQHAVIQGLTCVRLETGVKQPEAIGLYRAFGFREIGPFGDYPPDPICVFMEKRLGR